MAKIYKSSLDASKQKHLVIVSRWNEFITKNLLEGALQAYKSLSINDECIEIIYVPGAFEIGPTASVATKSKRYDAITCLGCVIQGNTPHFDYICSQTARLVAQASYDYHIPVIFGILTTNTIEQAIERAGTKAGNKGYEAAMSAVEMVNVYSQLK